MTPFTWHYADGTRPLPDLAFPEAIVHAPVYADKRHLLAIMEADGQMRPITSTAAWPQRRAHILANMQKVMGPLPDDTRRVPPEVQVVEESRLLPSLLRRKLTYASEPGDRVPAYLFIPTDVPEPKPAILCLHQTTTIGKSEPAGLGGKPDLHYALELAQRGYVTLAPDYPGYGEYAIHPYAHGYVSTTMKGIWNHLRAVDVLQSLDEVDGARIGCIGHSLGGHNTLFIGAFDERIGVMVTSCGFTSFIRYKGGDLTGWSHDGYMPRIATVYAKDPAQMPFDFAEIVAALAPRALFINAPLRDDNFDVVGVRDCVDAASTVYRLFDAADRLVAVYPDAGHEFPSAVREQAYRFIDRILRQERK